MRSHMKRVLFIVAGIIISFSLFSGVAKATTGTLNVGLAPSLILTNTISAGDVNVEVLKLKFSASYTEDIKIQSLRVTGNPSASYSSFPYLKLFDGNTQIGQAFSLSSSNTVTFSGFSFIVPKASSKVLTVKADVHPGASGVVGAAFIVNAQSDIGAIGLASASNVIVTGSFPINGPTLSVNPVILLPDLIVSDFTWTPQYPKSIEWFDTQIKIKNIGSTPASSFSVIHPGTGNTGSNTTIINGLAAGSEITITTKNAGLSIPGPNNVSIKVDVFEEVKESNENNNLLTKSIKISPSYQGEGMFTLKHWETLRLDNGLILFVDGANVLNQTPYKVRFKVYDSNYQVVATSQDLITGDSWGLSVGGVPKPITVKVESFPYVGSIGNADWSVRFNAYSYIAPPPLPSITVLSPNGGERWEVGKRYPIKWSSNALPAWSKIAIELTRGVTRTYLIYPDITKDSNVIYWTIPNHIVPADDYKIRVIALHDDGSHILGDYSDAPFSIAVLDQPFITVTSPNGGEAWQLGNIHTILWTPYGYNPDINPSNSVTAYLERLVDGRFIRVGKIVECGKASIHWAGHLDECGSNKLVEAGDYYIYVINNQTGKWDRSDSSFRLVPNNTIKVDVQVNGSDDPITVPVGGANYEIFWTSNIEQGTCDIFLPYPQKSITGLSPSGTKIINIQPNSKIFSSLGVRCDAVAPVEGVVVDSIVVLPTNPFITIISPNGGEILNITKDYVIEWKAEGIEKYSIALYKNDAFYAWIAKDFRVSNVLGGSYNWTPSTTITLSDIGNNLFKIYFLGYKQGGGTIEDKSDMPFSIVDFDQPSITVLSPNGGEVWEKGSTHTISWKSNDVSQIYIKLRKGDDTYNGTEGDVSHGIIINKGYYTWKVPNTLPDSRDYVIRVIGIDGRAIDDSDAPFSIVADTVDYKKFSYNDYEFDYPSLWLVEHRQDGSLFYNAEGETMATLGCPISEIGYEAWDIESQSRKINVDGKIILVKLWNLKAKDGLGLNDFSLIFINEDDFKESCQISIPFGKNYNTTTAYNIYSSVNIKSTTNLPPTINGISGPIILKTNETGKWEVKASDPENGTLSYSVQWGDDNTKGPDVSTASNISQTATFTHSYSRSGTYNPTFTVTDNQGFTAKTSISVNVKDEVKEEETEEKIEIKPSDCLPDGTLIKLPNDPKVYAIIDCKRKWVETQEEFEENNYEWKDVQEVESDVVNAYSNYLEAKAQLIRALNDTKVYEIINGKRLWIPTAEDFTQKLNHNWSDIEQSSQIDVYPKAKLIRALGNPKVYYITDSGLKRWIPTAEVFTSYNNRWEDIVEVDPKYMDIYPENHLIKLENDPRVYKIENGIRRWIKTTDAFRRLNLDWNHIAPVNQTEIDVYPEGGVIE